MTTTRIKLKRVYEPAEPEDGLRILVERLWPRGVSKEKAKIDYWAKDIAPSKELRQWYAHQPERWPHFREKYIEELNANPEALSQFHALCTGKAITFVYAARDEAHNSAVVLKHFFLETHS